MNVRFLNTIGLLSCWLFLIGNIIFDWLEKGQAHLYVEQPVGVKDYSGWYFAPQSFMIMCLMVVCNDFAQKESRIIKKQWFFFTLLSVSNFAKNLVLIPIDFAVNEYFMLGICVAITLYKFRKKNEKRI